MRNNLLVIVLLAAVMGISGCEKDGPAERAGESLDKAADELRESGRDLGNRIEDACEDVKEGMGAKNTNC